MKFLIIAVAIVSILSECASSTHQGLEIYLDCYWRVYNGEIPPDAVPAGRDSKGITYIGQGLIYYDDYFEKFIYGEIPLTLYPGNKTAVAPIGAPSVAAPNPKILCCALESSVKWIRTNSSTFLVDVVGEDPIIGGVEVFDGAQFETLYIGRTDLGNEIVTGRIRLEGEAAYFYYVKDYVIHEHSTFEVLVNRV